MFKRVIVVIGVMFLLLQFIRPPRNTSEASPTTDIASVVSVPPDIHQILRTSCYDCHSNATMYPWYAEIQPVGWWLNSHIQEARHELNFSEFTSYRPRRQYIKLRQMADEVTGETMPLPSYLIIHRDARLSEDQRNRLVSWVDGALNELKVKYPPDSLQRRPSR